MINKSISASIAALSISLLACTPAAHVGEIVTEEQVADGVDVTHAESRYLLDNGKIAGEETSAIDMNAKVIKIDKAKRLLTLSTPDGQTRTLKAGDQVRNFNQIKAGDNVAVQYYLSVAFEVRQPTEEEKLIVDETLNAGTRANLGEKPGVAVVSGALRVVTVTAIDKKNGTITVKDSAEEFTTVKAKYPQNLSYVKVGDSVVVTITEALVAGVSKLS